MIDDDDSDGHGGHGEIERLEARIETLRESVERCRQIGLIARLVIGGGFVWLALMLFGLIGFAPAGLVIALAAVIAGIVLFGSNASTWREHEAALGEAEALRAGLIERLDLRIVEERRRLH